MLRCLPGPMGLQPGAPDLEGRVGTAADGGSGTTKAALSALVNLFSDRDSTSSRTNALSWLTTKVSTDAADCNGSNGSILDGRDLLAVRTKFLRFRGGTLSRNHSMLLRDRSFSSGSDPFDLLFP